MTAQTALVFGGGGARAAYQVGILKAIVQFYPRNHAIPFGIVAGTSAGAINATSIATHASCFHLGVRKLEWVWRHIHAAQVYQCSHFQIGKHLLNKLLTSLQGDHIYRDAPSLMNNEPLRQLLNQLIDFKRIDRNIHHQVLTALSIDTSSYNSGRSTSFFQGQSHIHNWQRANRDGTRALITTEHLMASSAIPLIFPSIKLKQGYYGDGSVHQLSPLSSPIHLGANKIMVLNLDSPHRSMSKAMSQHPSSADIGGHLLDTIFSDTLNSDLERLTRVNQTLKYMTKEQQQTHHLRPIETLVIKPSEDLTDIAKHYFSDIPPAVRLLLRTIGINKNSDSSIISYLLFEKNYTGQLIDLGYQDAMCQIDEIKQFFAIG